MVLMGLAGVWYWCQCVMGLHICPLLEYFFYPIHFWFNHNGNGLGVGKVRGEYAVSAHVSVNPNCGYLAIVA